MSKKKVKLKLEKKIMAQINLKKIVMKPKWYFVVGSLLLFNGLVGLSVGVMFLINLTAFTLRKRGPMTSWRFQMMMENFPWWAPILAILGIILGIRLLKKYDFSYKKNFLLIITFFVLAVLLAGLLIDRLGLNDYWVRKGQMKRLYQQLELRKDFRRPGKGFNQRMK
ncbi:MAG: hypothetical protein U9Q63_04005 [Patescibacteria group bacterium]|nr:hypothetical protein [Patescibacteria group bacterium]